MSNDKSNDARGNATSDNSRPSQPTNEDLFTAFKRFTDVQLGAALHSLFGIPSMLQAPLSSSWMDKDIEERKRLVSASNLRNSSANDDGNEGSSFSGSAQSRNTNSSNLSPSSNSDSSQRALQELLQTAHSFSSTFNEFSRLFHDMQRQIATDAWPNKTQQQKDFGASREDEEDEENPWGDVFGGRLFTSFFDEFFSERPFGATGTIQKKPFQPRIGSLPPPDQLDSTKMEELYKSLARTDELMKEIYGVDVTSYPTLPRSVIHIAPVQAQQGKDEHRQSEFTRPQLPVNRSQQMNESETCEPESELDLHDYYDKLYHPEVEKLKTPYLLSTISSMTSHTSPDGITRTKHVRERRYSDGSVERSEKDDEHSSSSARQDQGELVEQQQAQHSIAGEGLEGWGEYGYPVGLGRRKEEIRRVFENERKAAAARNEKKQEQEDKTERKSGWFWASRGE